MQTKGRIYDMSWVHLGGGVVWGGVGCRGLSQVSLAHPVLNLTISCQGHCRQVHVIIREAYPQAESLTVKQSFSSHPEAVGLHGGPPYHAAGLSCHTHRIYHIGAWTNPAKQLHQNVECLL